MLILFCSAIFASSALLFFVQPMFAKMVIPFLGGSPAVWTACMLFFQATLLAGYLYAHVATTWLEPRAQAGLHLLVLALPLASLPIAVPPDWQPPAETNPVGWLFVLLAVRVGLPAFALSTTSPLLQKWFSRTDHPSGRDPYFLYSASNVGCMLALASYPVVVEPSLRLANQGQLWSVGYGVFLGLVAGCLWAAWRRATPEQRRARPATDPAAESSEPRPLTLPLRLRWVALAFVPSSLMLGVTSYITTDIGSLPLLWIVPLALYLVSFILVFARRPPIPHTWVVRSIPWLLLPLAVSMVAEPMWILVALHLAAFLASALMCHGELATGRPATRFLTEFYLLIAIGGVLGGLFNALVAPLLFPVILEYPLAIVLACLLWPGRHAARAGRVSPALDFALPTALALLAAGLAWWFRHTDLEVSPIVLPIVLLGVPAMICFTFMERPVRFALGIGAVMAGGSFYTFFHSPVMYTERSFFGVHRVTLDRANGFRQLRHGSTLHGWQSDDPERRSEPMAYFHKQGPLGDIFRTVGPEALQIGVIGLGTGTMVCYRRPGRHFTFFEIDPAVKRIAEDARWFTYLRDGGQSAYTIVLGDGRLMLARAPSARYDLLVLDAFSSDAIPIHLLTREAIAIYLSKLAERGLLAFHISNRYLDLERVLGDLAAAMGLECLACADLQISPQQRRAGQSVAHYVVMARARSDLGELAASPRWKPVPGRPGAAPWTDDFSNIVAALKW